MPTVDIKNVTRNDLNSLYDEIKLLSHEALRGSGMSVDDFALSDKNTKTLHIFAMRGAGEIADRTGMVKHDSQSAIDALTFYEEFEDPTGTDTDGDGILLGPDGVDIDTDEIGGRTHSIGQKLNLDTDYVVFSVDGLNSDIERRTILQEYIAHAISSYVLREWWRIKGLTERSMMENIAFEGAISNILSNSISNNRRKNVTVRYRPLG